MKLYDEKAKVRVGYEPLFFGEAKTLQRYDIMKYQTFDDVSEDMLENFWKKQEVKLLNDKNDHNNATPVINRIFTLNIKRQSVMDTIQGRSLLSTIGRVVTNSEFEKALTILQQQEVNHSDTYTYILRNLYDNPSEVFDEINEDVIITEHARKIKQIYEDLYVMLAKWEHDENMKEEGSIEYKYKKIFSRMGLYNFVSMKELKRLIYLAIISWNIIEGIRFFVSFACTFKFADNKIYMGNAQELKLIARDELTHLRISQKALRILHTTEDEGFLDIVKECREEAIELFNDACNDEIEWIMYLFRDGNMLGLNANILTRYMKHITNVRLRAVGFDKIFLKEECEDLPYMSKWLGGEQVEELPQEVDSTQYKIGMSIPMDTVEWNDISNNYKK